MLRTLTLENYRGFRRFEMHDLGRVNLIVGTNNSGKTSILEAVQLLAAASEVPLWVTLTNRGEAIDDSRFAVRHLFHGREIAVGSQFTLAAETNAGHRRMSAEIAEPRPEGNGGIRPDTLLDLLIVGGDTDLGRSLDLSLRWDESDDRATAVYRIDRWGGIQPKALLHSHRPTRGNRSVLYVTATSLSPATVIDLFEGIVLTPDEEVVVRALNIIEPSVERIAATGTDQWRRPDRGATAKAGIVLRCRGIPSRIPIGSMGDGIWRLLGLSLALVRCQGGVLLVDEIDTGLHYTVMEKMWRLVTETARRLNVQVFATTHSRDCFQSLAAVCREDVTTGSEVTIQRVEREKGRAVAYNEQEIVAASRWDMEVR